MSELVNIPNIGTVQNVDNFIMLNSALLSSQGLVFDGTAGTIGVDGCLLQGDGTVGTILEVASTASISRRFRITYSSVVAFGSTLGLDVNTSATIPTEGYILDTVNFSGGSTYLSGVQNSDNKARFIECNGISNSSSVGNMYMFGNATVTPIAASGTAYKVLGTTTANAINQRFSHASNRLTYTGEVVRDFMITLTGSVSCGNNKVVGMYVAKNGAIIPEAETYGTTDGNGRLQNITVQGVTELSVNDYIEIWVENDTDTTDVTVEILNAIVKPL